MTIEQYRPTILKTLQVYIATPHKYQNIKSQLIVSEDRNDYLIMTYGVHNTESIHKCIFHLQIKDSKIVILRDNTESGIFDKLLNAGLNSDRLIYPDLSQDEIKDFDLTVSLEKVYEEHKSLFEVKANFTKAIKPDATGAELVQLAKIEHEYINCAIAQHPNSRFA
ncbi:hypothetical protein H1P_840001 [Hyella patelloides LEGE 07179]|uniref:Uncharacterized protein n=1 Tax=Hyella patelloides LEGE 07179 TaxID=945734 RepID=A0A563W4Q0_9CYAN|nr:element excision factor XisI family protein [Hyella patelloides]VEP18620.1 hypothetical protein H1P_840001 [Hyella patelloides LEGE 07179]